MSEIICFSAGPALQSQLLLWLHFETAQIYEVNDDFIHRAIFREDKFSPRAIFAGAQQQLNGLRWLRHQNNKKLQLQLQSRSCQEAGESLWNKFINFSLSEKNYAAFKQTEFMDSNLFAAGQQVLSCANNRQLLQQRLRFQLQLCDSCSGTMIFSPLEDPNASFVSSYVEIFQDCCPKSAQTCFGFQDSANSDPNMRFNRMVSQMRISNRVSLNTCVDKRTTSFDFAQEGEQLTQQKCLSPLFSCFTSSFRLKDSNNLNNFTAFVSNLTPLPRRNLFNCAYTLPRLSSSSHSDIFSYRDGSLNYLKAMAGTPKHRFSQYYSLRGSVELKPLPPMMAVDFKMTDQLLTWPDQFALELHPDLKEFQHPNPFPFHTCFFSSELEGQPLEELCISAERVRKEGRAWLLNSGIQDLEVQQWLQQLKQTHELYTKP